jgi:uncharacterized protein YukE
MGMLGLDPVVVERIGNQLQHQADQIHQVITAVEALINEAEGAWHGPDASQFRDWWQQQHKPNLMHAADAVAGLGRSAIANANEQINTSNH